MGVEITMPQLSDTMHEGTILNWLKKEGDSIRRGDALAEVATDKADLEIESFHEGTLIEIRAPQGTTVKVGSVIAVIGEKSDQSARGSSAPQTSAPAPQAAPVASQAARTEHPRAEPPRPAGAQPTANGSTASRGDAERVKISPLARNLAESYGVDVRSVEGTGDGGRIVKRDIERAVGRELGGPAEPGAPEVSSRAGAAAEQPAPAAPMYQPQTATTAPAARREAPPFPAGSSGAEPGMQPLSRMRQTIAQRMVESTTTIPHFYVTAKVHLDALVKLRNSLKPLPQYEGLTYNHLIIRAAGIALRAFPRINAAYADGKLLQPESVNIGIVTAVPDGLLIPVLKKADELHLADIVAEARGLVQRARAGRPKAEDLVGGTFSISNMGMFDVESFTAIISPGQGAILAISPIQEEPIVVDGQIRVGSVMRVTLSVDHRIIDGVMCGEFLTELKRLLEDPVLLLA